MALLTVAEIREHIETDLTTDALTRLLDDADAEIIDRLGALATETEVFEAEGLLRLVLRRKAQSITSAKETILETDYTLASNDYSLLSDGYTLERRQGTNEPHIRWRGIATIVYVPKDETARRKRLLVDLVKLIVQYDARASKSLGDYSVQNRDYAKEREALFLAFYNTNRRLNIA